MCRLIRQHPATGRTGLNLINQLTIEFNQAISDPNNQLLSCVNQAQFLAISISSVELFCQKLNHDSVSVTFLIG